MSFAQAVQRRLRKGLPEALRLPHWNIVRGDKVQVMSGRDKGKQGEVVKVQRKLNRVFVTGVKLVKKHVPSTDARKGGIFQIESSVHVSRLALLDPSDDKPTKVTRRYIQIGDDIQSVRVSKRTGLVVPKSAELTQRKTRKDGPKDTPPASVFGTYTPSMTPAGTVKTSLAAALGKLSV